MADGLCRAVVVPYPWLWSVYISPESDDAFLLVSLPEVRVWLADASLDSGRALPDVALPYWRFWPELAAFEPDVRGCPYGVLFASPGTCPSVVPPYAPA